MLVIKSAQLEWEYNQRDFKDQRVKRLHRVVKNMADYAMRASETISNLLDEGKFDISEEEVEQMIGFELDQLGLREISNKKVGQ